MDIQQQGSSREKVVEKCQEEKLKQEGKEGLPAKQQQQQVTAAASPASPPSASSSPSHEFSFTISVHSSSTPAPDKTKTPHNSFAIDLTPADDIFFHGHLLPLHLLSHLPVSPRSSINSLDSFTLPIRELLDDQRPNTGNCNNIRSSNEDGNINATNSFNNSHRSNYNQSNNGNETKGRSKPKSFSLFGWRKGSEVGGGEREEDRDKQKRKLRFDVSHLLKRYVRMVRPLLFFKGRRDHHNLQFQRQPYSFSDHLSWRNKRELRGRRGEYSAPASMRTSPTNSGLLVATATLPSTTSDSTMEELQAAIQAAIAHCKNSINAAADESIKCQSN
ncbi:hypothetical protein Tsubulata_006570 [Turnera subulata]|uniref:BRI1 kinase inhibitor 1 n=1 Tax=Turnera subulata TaxID=218843 RepID=A0A9Q0FWA1_9ROSI|nr:hypothetical protein Tsubulata_006570 [Turnera subulata]